MADASLTVDSFFSPRIQRATDVGLLWVRTVGRPFTLAELTEVMISAGLPTVWKNYVNMANFPTAILEGYMMQGRLRPTSRACTHWCFIP